MKTRTAARVLVVFGLAGAAWAQAPEGLLPRFPLAPSAAELVRPAQPQAYFDKVGRKFALLGTEAGTVEAWAYPLKLLRHFELSFLIGSSTEPISGRDIVRSVRVAPEATTLTFAFQSFTVRATYVASPAEAGAVILLAVDATEPLTIVASFLPVLQPMWPAGLGGQYASWDGKLKAYLISEPTRRNHGFIGSPAAEGISYTPAHMLSDSPNQFKVVVGEPKAVGDKFIPLILAGGKGAREDVRKTYERLAADPRAVYQAAREHFRKLQAETLRVSTPERDFDKAFAWAKVAYDNLFVDNPDLGLGLVAGLGLSGTGGRPGFGWFFGGDAYLNSFSLLGMGSFETVREMLSFTRRFQRADGKMAHEVSQSAGFIRWFEDYPYAYIHADTTPLYIVALEEYVRASGDRGFLRESWPSLRKAFDWCLTTDSDGDGLMDNRKAGLGALEFGALTGIQTDVFLAAAWCRAARAMARMAGILGEKKDADRAGVAADKALAAFRSQFIDLETGLYVYALHAGGEKVREVTPWPSFGLAWDLAAGEGAVRTLERLCRPDMMTDWGVRMISSESGRYDPLSYNYGAVWPFLTGWLATALYRNGFPLQAEAALSANVRHTFENGLGSVTELFTGVRNIWPAEAVAHQGFSTGGIVLPVVKGLLGIEIDSLSKSLVFRPSFPAAWEKASIEGIRAGGATFNIEYSRGEQGIVVRFTGRGAEGWTVVAAPGLGPGARVSAARLNGAGRRFEDFRSERAVRPEVRFAASGSDVLEFDIPPFVEILPNEARPEIGAPSRGLRLESVRGDGRLLEVKAWGWAGESYALPMKHGGLVRSVEGAAMDGDGLRIAFPAGKRGEFAALTIVLRLD